MVHTPVKNTNAPSTAAGALGQHGQNVQRHAVTVHNNDLGTVKGIINRFYHCTIHNLTISNGKLGTIPQTLTASNCETKPWKYKLVVFDSNLPIHYFRYFSFVLFNFPISRALCILRVGLSLVTLPLKKILLGSKAQALKQFDISTCLAN